MEREIKFRARNTAGTRWLIGLPHTDADGAFFIERNFGCNPKQADRRTLGEFTGFRDSRDMPIFEGDILKGCRAGYYWYGEVKMCEGSWTVKAKTLQNIAIIPADLLSRFPKVTITVVGNIHENADLLDKEEKVSIKELTSN